MSRKRWKANSYPSFIKNDPAANIKTFENLIDSWDITFMRSHDGFIPTPSRMSELKDIFQESDHDFPGDLAIRSPDRSSESQTVSLNHMWRTTKSIK